MAMYPNTDNKSLFDISQFGMPKDLLSLKLPTVGNYNINPNSQYYTGGMDASNLNFLDFGKLGNASDYLSDFKMDSVGNQTSGMNFSSDLDSIPNWGNDSFLTGSSPLTTPEFNPQMSNTGIGWNMPTLQTGIQGLSALGNLWGAFQGNKLARKQLGLATDAYNTNLTNQVKSYNTSLEDRVRSRYAYNDAAGQAKAEEYIDANKLTR